MHLNIGCGFDKISDAVNIDYDRACDPDILLDLEKEILPFPDNSVGMVTAHHILDRMGDGYFHLMRELYRVCVSGAIIDIITTHPRHDNFYSDPTIKRGMSIEGMWLFSKKHNDSCKKKGIKSSSLAYIHNVDFEIIDMAYSVDPRYNIEKSMEDDLHEHNTTMFNNVRMETYIKLITVK